MTRVTSAIRQAVLALLLVLVPCSASAQVGRILVSAETYVGLSRVVYVGKIVGLERIEYKKPLTSTQKLGKPYRLVFQVAETIRGKKVKRLRLVLSLQSTSDLNYLRDHSVEIMLVGGQTRLNRYPGPEIGIEEQGKRVDGDWYYFRVLDPVEVPKSGEEAVIAAQINRSYDSCRMFTNELKIVAGKEAILKRVRAFAKKHPKGLSGVLLWVPNEFGALCGSPNAYCMIRLPVCSETKATLLGVKKDPGLILRRIKSRNEKYNRSTLLTAVNKALAVFREGSGR